MQDLVSVSLQEERKGNEGKLHERKKKVVCREEKIKDMCIFHQAKQNIYLQEFQERFFQNGLRAPLPL